MFGEEVRITTEGQRHLGAVLGFQEHKDQYCSGKIQGSRENLELPVEIAKSHPMPPTLPSQRATNRNLHSSKFKGPEDYVEPVDQATNDIFLPVLFGQTEPLPEELRELFTLPPAQGGLGIPDMEAEAPQQYAASKLIIAPHVAAICTQSTFMPVGEQTVEDLKRQQQPLKTTAATMTC